MVVGRVTGLGQRRGHPARSRFNVVGPVVYSREDAVDAAARERPHGVVATDLAQLAHSRRRQIVIRVTQLGAACGGEPVSLGRPATSTVLPGCGGAGLSLARVHQRVEVPAHAGGGDAELVTDLTCGDGSGLQQKLDYRATGVAVGSSVRTEFHNTIVTEFQNPVKQGHPYTGPWCLRSPRERAKQASGVGRATLRPGR